ncbi:MULTISPECIES: hypothetical protein [Kitasatospora]|uniref:Uncharacterized protein n=1 Tax=Kitasatospora setae (strain ATCC 33774 / DSM 43861 / JCM 3304 / KCC A-0304 / NBRC 14216 / KM-6054) TaxID=452652 RepID=E4NHN4_KITSK|nr:MULTISPECIES: hypothetical protein [Kitasatospora]BAJ31014.1 hypothetical protein KSE_52380 [Kitasatospora setae KM-6054]
MCEAIDIKGNQDENLYVSVAGSNEVAIIAVWDVLDLPALWCSECSTTFEYAAEAAAHVGLTPAEIEV